MVGGEPFAAFYARQRRPLIALAYAVSGSRQAAEDLAQDALEAGFRDWERIRRLDEPAAWVRRILLNRATSGYRRRLAELRAVTRLRANRAVAFPEVTGEADRIWAEVRRLPRRQVQVIALRYVDELTLAEVGEVLGCSKDTVATHLRRARETLSRRLRLEEEA